MDMNMNMNMDLGFEFGGGADNNEWNLSNIVNNMQTLPAAPYNSINNNINNNNNPYTGSQEQAPLSMPEHNHFSVPNVIESQYDPGYMQFDGSANRSEPYSHLQQPFVPMTPNPFVHQYGYMPMQPEPTPPPNYSLPYGSQTMMPSSDPQQGVNSMQFTGYSLPYGSQTMMPSSDQQQGVINSMQFTGYSLPYGSQTVAPSIDQQQGVNSMQFTGSMGQLDQMNGYNQLLGTPDFQYQSSIMHEPSIMSSNFTSSQAPRTWNQGLSGTLMNEGLPSRVSSSNFPEISRPLRLERPPGAQVEQVTSAPANELIATQRGKEKLPESETTRTKPSKEIQRILNMKTKGRLSAYDTTSTAPPQRSQTLNLKNGKDSSKDNLGKQLAKKKPDQAKPRMPTVGEGEYEPRRRGRPRKIQQGTQGSKSGKLREETANTGSTQEANESVGNEEESGNTTNLASSLRIPNALYDPKYAREGLPVDPFLRLFQEKFGK